MTFPSVTSFCLKFKRRRISPEKQFPAWIRHREIKFPATFRSGIENSLPSVRLTFARSSVQGGKTGASSQMDRTVSVPVLLVSFLW